jgi:hypothetical protein
MTETLTFWEAATWFVYGMGAVMFPTLAAVGWTMYREAKKPPRKPADPEEMRQVAADLARLSRTIARMAETEEPAAKEEARASA